ncbi:MAG: SoxR reducing system RseC family protein [Clostridiales bacterium]|nr:SoxR reducing system RseC family protein [Clostridiales bacterium]
MDNEIGIISKIEDNEVEIEFLRSSACGKCGACMIAEDTGKMIIRLPYKKKVNVGDEVYIDIDRNFYLLSSVLLYVLPLVILIAVILLGDLLFIGEYAQSIIGISAVVLSFGSYYGLKIFKKKFKDMKKEKISYYKV